MQIIPSDPAIKVKRHATRMGNIGANRDGIKGEGGGFLTATV